MGKQETYCENQMLHTELGKLQAEELLRSNGGTLSAALKAFIAS